MFTLPKKFLKSQKGVAAIEFALLMPLLLVLMLGSFELQRYLRIERRLSLTAQNIAAIVAQRERLDGREASLDFDSAIHTFPSASEEPPTLWHHVLVHQISSVVFAPTTTSCTTNCTYTANLTWNWPTYDVNFGLGALRRVCGALTPAPQGAAATGSTLPAALFGPGSLIVVDLRYRFRPLFGSTFIPEIILSRQGYANARFATPFIRSTVMATTVCPGF